ncbi:BtrH N-terminal domain-containing protein [Nonomuraea turcica]|uniref:BtrH N-terminal domain-containing protein n=1 Tax=Nonomuraea sp. G32 TaxID=3067274 RepID=UPI00273CADBA|nr:BtrH N-terminal domain-containing protein [Nonomuraea sp. G32]MDP4510992.1 BtrH N-terminal domain-containing protein [Nonomuraea sp. G32]
MTDHKHLKHRVRERMAKTGESYTTAHRHVTARAERHHHESALLLRVLGGGYSEAMLLGLGGGIGFMYFVFEYAGHAPMLTIVAQAHPEPMIPRALDRAGIPYESRQTGSPKVAERHLRAALDAGRQPICRVGRFQLPWRPDLPFPDPVDVVVTGISGDTVHVYDDEPGELPLADFMAAWSAIKKSKHHLIEVTGPAIGAPDVTGAIRDTVAKLTGPVLGNSFDVNFGLSGMRKLAAQLADTTGKQGWTRRFGDDPGPVLDRLRDCLEVEYTTPGATRPLYADFLTETGHAEAAAVYREAGRQWSRVASARTSFPELAELVTEAVRLEEAGVEALRRV